MEADLNSDLIYNILEGYFLSGLTKEDLKTSRGREWIRDYLKVIDCDMTSKEFADRWIGK